MQACLNLSNVIARNDCLNSLSPDISGGIAQFVIGIAALAVLSYLASRLI